MGANDLEREGIYVWLDGSEGKFTINTCKKTYCDDSKLFYWRLKHPD